MPTNEPHQPLAIRMWSSFTRALGLYNLQDHPDTNWSELDDGGEAPGQEGDLARWRRETNMPIQDRLERYRIFDDMDYGLVSGILDLYAEEATQPDHDRGKTVWVESSNTDMVKEGAICLRNLMVEDTAYPITREVCKYGDHFRFLHYATGKGVVGWTPIAPKIVQRLDDRYGRLTGFKVEGMKFRKNTSDVSYPFDLIHFRLMGGKSTGAYGLGLLDALFSPWRQMTLAEDTVLMYSFRRAASRNMVLVDTNALGEAESMKYLNSVRKKFRKNEFVDPASPSYRKSFNPMSTVDDIFLPVRGPENGTRIEQLIGAADASSLADLDHFRRKFFGTARVPSAFMGFEGDVNSKATLVTQDVRFARGVKRVRRGFLYGIRRAIELHYSFLSTNPESALYDPSKPDSFSLHMTPINALEEFERLELVKAKVELMTTLAALGDTLRLPPPIWAGYVLRTYAKLPEEIVAKLVQGMVPNQEKAEVEYRLGYGTFTKGEHDVITEAVSRSMGLQVAMARLDEYYIDESTYTPARVGQFEIVNESQEVADAKIGLQLLHESAKGKKK